MPRWFISDSVRQVYGDNRRIGQGVVRRYHDLLLRKGNRQAMIDYFTVADQFFELQPDGSPKYAGKIAELRCPVLLMWGEADAWLPVTHVEAFRRDVTDLQVKIYPGVGHVPMEEIPLQSVTDAMAFLAQA